MLKRGYSWETIAGNINALQRQGSTREAAIAEAYNLARKTYFKRFPAGALPLFLAYPKTHRVAKYYAPNGAPIREINENPSGEKVCYVSVKLRGRGVYGTTICGKPVFKIGMCERHYNAYNKGSAKAIAYSGQQKYNKNPRDISTRAIGKAELERRAAKLYKDFTGRQPGAIVHLPAPRPFKVGVAFGTLVEVTYQSERDGQLYRHTFRKTSRPLVVASHDGKQLQIVGGRFAFTERGIVDK